MWSGKPAGDDGEMPLHIYRFSVLPEHYESPADILRRVNLAVTDCRCTFQKLWEGRAAVLGPSPMVNVPLDSAARYLLGLYDYVEGREDYEEPHWVQTDGGLNEALTTLYTEVYGHPPEVR